MARKRSLAAPQVPQASSAPAQMDADNILPFPHNGSKLLADP